MSNFAEIRFTAINANNSTVLIGEVFHFILMEIKLTAKRHLLMTFHRMYYLKQSKLLVFIRGQRILLI